MEAAGGYVTLRIMILNLFGISGVDALNIWKNKSRTTSSSIFNPQIQLSLLEVACFLIMNINKKIHCTTSAFASEGNELCVWQRRVFVFFSCWSLIRAPSVCPHKPNASPSLLTQTHSTDHNHYSKKQESLWLAGAALIAINCVDKYVEQQRSSFILASFVLFHLAACLSFLSSLATDIKAGFLLFAAFASGQVCVV